jgi:hypothetical protein
MQIYRLFGKFEFLSKLRLKQTMDKVFINNNQRKTRIVYEFLFMYSSSTSLRINNATQVLKKICFKY